MRMELLPIENAHPLECLSHAVPDLGFPEMGIGAEGLAIRADPPIETIRFGRGRDFLHYSFYGPSNILTNISYFPIT